LLAHGANINERKFHGVTPLMEAAGCGKKDAVQLLLANRADASLRDIFDKTAQDYAQENYWPAVEAILKGQGAQTDKNPRNQTPPK
jgi:uncharacterized protein